MRGRPLLLAPVFTLSLALVACDPRGSAAPEAVPPQGAQPRVAPEPAPAPKTPVHGVVLRDEGFDRDGDGKVETWYQRDPESGDTIEATDTDGDGQPDSFRKVEIDPNPPPGFEVGPRAMQELPEPPPGLEPGGAPGPGR